MPTNKLAAYFPRSVAALAEARATLRLAVVAPPPGAPPEGFDVLLAQAGEGLPPLGSEAEAVLRDRLRRHGHDEAARNFGGVKCLVPHRHGSDNQCVSRDGGRTWLRTYEDERVGLRRLLVVCLRSSLQERPRPFCPRCGGGEAERGRVGDDVGGTLDDLKTAWSICKFCRSVGSTLGGVEGDDVGCGVGGADPPGALRSRVEAWEWSMQLKRGDRVRVGDRPAVVSTVSREKCGPGSRAFVELRYDGQPYEGNWADRVDARLVAREGEEDGPSVTVEEDGVDLAGTAELSVPAEDADDVGGAVAVVVTALGVVLAGIGYVGLKAAKYVQIANRLQALGVVPLEAGEEPRAGWQIVTEADPAYVKVREAVKDKKLFAKMEAGGVRWARKAEGATPEAQAVNAAVANRKAQQTGNVKGVEDGGVAGYHSRDPNATRRDDAAGQDPPLPDLDGDDAGAWVPSGALADGWRRVREKRDASPPDCACRATVDPLLVEWETVQRQGPRGDAAGEVERQWVNLRRAQEAQGERPHLDALKPGDLILDVRTPEEFKARHLDGAVNIPVDELAARLGKLPEAGTCRIVVFCAAGLRAARAVHLLRDRGHHACSGHKDPSCSCEFEARHGEPPHPLARAADPFAPGAGEGGELAVEVDEGEDPEGSPALAVAPRPPLFGQRVAVSRDGGRSWSDAVAGAEDADAIDVEGGRIGRRGTPNERARAAKEAIRAALMAAGRPSWYRGLGITGSEDAPAVLVLYAEGTPKREVIATWIAPFVPAGSVLAAVVAKLMLRAGEKEATAFSFSGVPVLFQPTGEVYAQSSGVEGYDVGRDPRALALEERVQEVAAYADGLAERYPREAREPVARWRERLRGWRRGESLGPAELRAEIDSLDGVWDSITDALASPFKGTPSPEVEAKVKEVAAVWQEIDAKVKDDPKLDKLVKPARDEWTPFWADWQAGKKDLLRVQGMVADANVARRNALGITPGDPRDKVVKGIEADKEAQKSVDKRLGDIKDEAKAAAGGGLKWGALGAGLALVASAILRR